MAKITVVRFGHFSVHRRTLFNICFYRFFGAPSTNLASFLSSVTWFMELPDPTNAQAMFISTIVGAGAAFFGLYVGKPGASIPKGKK